MEMLTGESRGQSRWLVLYLRDSGSSGDHLPTDVLIN